MRDAIAQLVDRFVEDVHHVIVAAAHDAVLSLFGEPQKGNHSSAKVPGVGDRPPSPRRRTALSKKTSSRAGPSKARGRKKAPSSLHEAIESRATESGGREVSSSGPQVPAVEQVGTAGTPKRRARIHRGVAPQVPEAIAEVEANQASSAGRTPTEREAAALQAVRVLVRATAGEVAQVCGLANGTAYVALRSLVASRRVAKFS